MKSDGDGGGGATGLEWLDWHHHLARAHIAVGNCLGVPWCDAYGNRLNAD